MSTDQPISRLLGRLWRHIEKRRRLQFGGLFLLMVFASLAEVISIGAILPFLAALTSPERVFGHPYAQPFIAAAGISDSTQLLLPLTVTFGLAALFSGAMRVTLLWAQTRLSQAIGADFSMGIYRRSLYQPYAVHISRNSSEVIAGILGKAHAVVHSVILPTLTILGSTMVLASILVALVAIEPLIAVTAFAGFGGIYAIVIFATRKRLLVDSQRVNRESNRVIKALQEGLGGIRDVLIDGTQAIYCAIYRSADQPLRRSQANIQIISGSPRYLVEALGMVLIAALAFNLAKPPGGIVSAIPVLGALALGAQRLLPVLQQIYSSWSSMRGGQASLQDALDLLDQPIPAYTLESDLKPLPFTEEIALSQLDFRYTSETPWVLQKLDLTIPKGGRVGFIGSTGSGKSTLLDIIMGLLSPTSGQISIDGEVIGPHNMRAWQSHVAHVPQSIFLADATLAENIAFGVPLDQIDQDRVREAAQKAQIAQTIESWSLQYQTRVGERGVRLSGGQRQRIGIARALYKMADVIIFDEATSALDNETEQAVMQSIEKLSTDLTVLIIAHRLSTLKKCDQIVELADGKIIRVGKYEQLVGVD